MIQKLIAKCMDYLKANPILGYVLVGVCALIVIVLIVLIAKAINRKKEAKRLANEQAAKAQKELMEKQKAEEEKRKAEESAAARKAVEAKLEAQRLQAEKQAAEKAEAERLEAERIAAEKALEEQAAREQEHAEEKAIEQADAEAEAEEKAIQEIVEARTKKEQEVLEEKQKAVQEQELAEEQAIEQADAEAEAEEQAIEEIVEKRTQKEAEEKEKAEKASAFKMGKMPPLRQSITPTFVPVEEDATDKKGYSGKWAIYRVVMDVEDELKEEMYFFELLASNGEKLLSSEEYTSYAGAMRGIKTHKANIEKGNFKITTTKKGDYIFKLLSGKNMLLCMGENYPTLARCESAVQSTKRFAKTAVIDETVQTRTIRVMAEDDAELPPIPDGYNGKWLIFAQESATGETVYYFELYANNGEKLISSEEYTTYVGAVNGIQTHKTNIQRNNFRISLTKRGDYIYKILNGNGQLLSLGEHYKTKRLCQNAVESVRRFALNSPVLTDPKYIK